MALFTAVLAASLALAPESTGQVQLLPSGEFSSRDGRPGPGKVWRIDDAGGERIAAALNAVIARTPLVIDYEHHTLTAQTAGHKALAAGWIKHVEWRPGSGLWGDQVEWTAAASAHIEAGEYRYISPVITYDAAGNVTGVALAALVNHPGLLGMAPAMAAALAAYSPPIQQEPSMALLAALIAGLGLKADATEADVTAAVAALQAQVKATPAVPTALATALQLDASADATAALSAVQALQAGRATADQTVAALQAEVARLSGQHGVAELSALVDQGLRDGKLLPVQKDWAAGLSVAALKAYLAAAPVIAPPGTQTQGSDPGPGAAHSAAALSAQQAAVFASFGISEADALKHLQAQAGKA